MISPDVGKGNDTKYLYLKLQDKCDFKHLVKFDKQPALTGCKYEEYCNCRRKLKEPGNIAKNFEDGKRGEGIETKNN